VTANTIEGSANLTWDDVTLNVTGALTVTGAFTSSGIDDNATGENLQLSDGIVDWGDGLSGEQFTHRIRGVTNGVQILVGGNIGSDGGGIQVFGSTHSGNGGDVVLISNNQTWGFWDESAGTFIIKTGTGAKTLALTLDSSRNATFAGSVTTLGGAAAARIIHADPAQLFIIGGGATGSADPALVLTGGTNANAYDIGLRTGGGTDNILDWDESAGSLVLSTAAGFTKSTALTLDAAQNATFTGWVNAQGLVTTANGQKGLTINTGGNGSLVGLEFNSNTRTVAEATTAVMSVIDRLNAEAFKIDVAGTVTARDLNVTGTFTSPGIDDNATAERIQLEDNAIKMGVSGSVWNIQHISDTNSLEVFGGAGDGGSLLLYGGTHATFANDFYLQASNNNVVAWDESAGSFVINTGTGAKTLALTLDSSQNATFTGTVTAPTMISENTGGYFLLQNAQGNNAFPTYSFSGDGNTGMLRDSVDALGFVVGGVRALTINASQDATFAGTVTTDGDLTVGDDSTNVILYLDSGVTSNSEIQWRQNGTQKAFIRYRDSDDAFLLDADAAIQFKPANTTALTLDASQNATFAGTIVGSAGNEVDSGLFAIKASDESVSSSTTLQDDNDLTLTLAANTTYSLSGFFVATSASSTPDIKFDFIEADGTYMIAVLSGAVGASGTIDNMDGSSGAQTVPLIGGSNAGISVHGGTVWTGGSGGVFKLQWAQNTSDATATTMKAGSWIKATKLA
jgi:hypothetical protein